MPPAWLPAIPPRLKHRVAPFTAHRDGFIRRLPGAPHPIAVLGKAEFLRVFNSQSATAALELLHERWEQRRKLHEAKSQGELSALRASGGMELVHLASEYFDYLDHRVKHSQAAQSGRAKRQRGVRRLAETTAWDVKRTVVELGRAIGPHTPVNHLGPDHFARYDVAIAENAASSYARKVAYVEAMLRWALQLGRFADNRHIRALAPGMDPVRALIGPQLVKPSSQDLRDERLQKAKALAPLEIAKLWHVADDEERLMIALGLNGALDNADVMALSWGVVAPASSYKARVGFEGLVLDYRRRKRGRVRRVIPLLPEVACRLADQLVRRGRPAPGVADFDDDDFVFVGRDGDGMARMSEAGPQNLVTRKFTRLFWRAGLRPPPRVTKDPETGKRHVTSAGSGDGRGFRSLRTSFANLAPTGFRDEIEIVMGHAHGQVILDSYMETHGFSRLFDLVSAVWTRAFAEPPDSSWRSTHPEAPRPQT